MHAAAATENAEPADNDRPKIAGMDIDAVDGPSIMNEFA